MYTTDRLDDTACKHSQHLSRQSNHASAYWRTISIMYNEVTLEIEKIHR